VQAYCDGRCVATIVCKIEEHQKSRMFRGYIAMLVVIKPYRGKGIGKKAQAECVPHAIIVTH
jgi:peptide alpha-N-acetyltransferase